MKRAKLRNALLLLAVASNAPHAQTSGSVPVRDGTCPAGTHLVHASGTIGIDDPETFQPGPDAWADFSCEADESSTSLMCGTHGDAIEIGGVAECGCDDGYAGASCNVCATGFEPGSTPGSCAPSSVNRDLVILGAESIVPYGGSTRLTAERLTPSSTGAPVQIAGTWRLGGDPIDVGCLAPVTQPSVCVSSVEGSEVMYSPPAQGGSLMSTTVLFAPSAGAVAQVDVKAGPPGQTPINGWADGDTLPVINTFLDFMHKRCAGAGSIGIAKYGKVVAALGLGMKDGRNAQNIFNPACSSDATDPFKPNAGEMQYDTPFMIGSVSKATSFATARWALKNALGAQDVDVRMLNQSASRTVTAHRTYDGALRIDVWNVANDGSFGKLGNHSPGAVKDFSLVRMGDTRFIVIARSATNMMNLYTYTIDAAGKPTLTSTINGATEVKQVQVVAVANQRIVVGLHRSNDQLQVRTFKFEANGTLTQLDVENGGQLRDLRMMALPGTTRVVGAARLVYPDVLKFIVWNVDASGNLSRIHETDFDQQFFESNRYEFGALDGNSFVFAAQHLAHEPISIHSFAVAGSGALSQTGGTFLDDVHDFRIAGLSSTRFAIAASDADRNGTLQQFSISAQGFPFRVGPRVNSGKYDSLDVANTSAAGWGTGVVTAVRQQNGLLNVTSWDVEANTIAKLKTSAGDVVKNYAWTDDDVEALKLVGFDFPNSLLSKRLHEIVGGFVEPPMHFNATDQRTSASCIATQAGNYPFADAKWRNITLGHFFAHRAGLNDSAIAAETLITDYIDELRGLENKWQWNAQQDRLIDEWGSTNVKNARTAIGLSPVVNANAPDGFIVPRLSLEDLLVGSASMCLPNAQGTYAYSNTDPQWVRAVAEHVTGKRFAAPVGDPSAVQGTLLNDFIQSQLALTSNGLNGIAARPAALNAQGADPFGGPKARHWNATSQRYYDTYWDVKRPHCLWQNGTCDFDNPKVGPTLDWNGNVQQVPLLMRSTGEGAATGSLGVQIVPHLKFMSKFWSSGYDTSSSPATFEPSIGEPRNGVWTVGQAHNGGDNGTWAWAMQYGGSASCPESEGVDVIVSVNQWKDVVCDSQSTGCETDPMRYKQLKAIIDIAVCSVDWTKVTPIPWLND